MKVTDSNRATVREMNKTRGGQRYIKIGRASGEHHGNSKLTNETVIIVREMLASGFSERAIAELLDIGKTTVGNIKRGITWSRR